MRSSLLSIAALLSTSSKAAPTKSCLVQNTASTQDLQYTIDPNFILFPLSVSASELFSEIRIAGFNKTLTSDPIAKVRNLFHSPCQMTISAHSSANISESQLSTLFSASMEETDLFCHSASHKIGALLDNRHTMMSRHTKIQVDSAFIDYSITCTGQVLTHVEESANDELTEMRDCAFCKSVVGEFGGICRLPKLGKFVNETNLAFKRAVCDGCGY